MELSVKYAKLNILHLVMQQTILKEVIQAARNDEANKLIGEEKLASNKYFYYRKLLFPKKLVDRYMGRGAAYRGCKTRKQTSPLVWPYLATE